MTNSLLSRVVNRHGHACLHSAHACGGTKQYNTTDKDSNTKTLTMRYSEYERKEREREGGGENDKPFRE